MASRWRYSSRSEKKNGGLGVMLEAGKLMMRRNTEKKLEREREKKKAGKKEKEEEEEIRKNIVRNKGNFYYCGRRLEKKENLKSPVHRVLVPRCFKKNNKLVLNELSVEQREWKRTYCSNFHMPCILYGFLENDPCDGKRSSGTTSEIETIKKVQKQRYRT